MDTKAQEIRFLSLIKVSVGVMIKPKHNNAQHGISSQSHSPKALITPSAFVPYTLWQSSVVTGYLLLELTE